MIESDAIHIVLQTQTAKRPEKHELEKLFKRAQEETRAFGVDWFARKPVLLDIHYDREARATISLFGLICIDGRYAVPKQWLDDFRQWLKPEATWPEPTEIDTRYRIIIG